MRKILNVVFLCLVFLLHTGFAQAQAPAPQPALDATADSTQKTLYKFDERNFADPSYANLAKLYWNLGILDINDGQIIDNYLAITDCELYQTYKPNDLEWSTIRDLARASIRKNYKSWPTSFRVVIPLYLRDYHEDNEYFDVDMDLSAVNAVRRIETIFNASSVTCNMGGELNGYPRNLVLFLNRPFSLPEIPVERELARLYLDDVNITNKKENDLAIKGLRNAKGLRVAYLEIFFKVHSFKEVIDTQAGLQAVVFTQIDHIRVYADMDREKLLFERSMFESGKYRRRKHGGPVTDKDLNLPSGPLLGEGLKDKGGGKK